MKGYKGFEADLTCRGFQFEVGKTYEIDGSPELCAKGFHFCRSVRACDSFYDHGKSRFCEIEAIGEVIDGGCKLVTNKIRIVRELTRLEVNRNYYDSGSGSGDGDGYGDGDGDGYGDGYGYGYGYGDGYGDGYGYGYGDGDGDGSGYGKNINRVLQFKEVKK